MSMPVIVPSGTSRPQSVSDLIESIALQEVALSHILNAEGEKLQAIIAKGTTDDILKTNKGVESMINSITRLEIILQSKLELLSCEICP